MNKQKKYGKITDGPKSYDVFREYKWKGPHITYGTWQAVTDINSTHRMALKTCPVNKIEITDLQNAMKAEICIEQWSGHAGTSDKKIRVNNSEWIRISEPDIGPQRPESYQYLRCVNMELDINLIYEGINTFQFGCGSQTYPNWNWGQWGVYGVIFRIYYSHAKKHVEGRIIKPAENTTISGCLKIDSDTEGNENDIKCIDYIGYYEDFDHNGDGVYTEWHYNYRYGEIRHHLGSVILPPYMMFCDVSWLPEQSNVRLIARLTDLNNVIYMTPVLKGLSIISKKSKVKMYKPLDVPIRWQTRMGKTQTCTWNISDNLKNAIDARLVIATWSGQHADEIGINGRKLMQKTGRLHNYACEEIPIPLEYLKQGMNEFYTRSCTEHHGIEVLWPGAVLKVKYAKQ